MRLSDKLYEWLLRGPTPDCDRVLAAALEHAEPPYFERLVQCLLQRRQPAAWGGLLPYFQRLPADVREALVADPELLHAGIVETMKTGPLEGRCQALTLLEQHPSAALAYILPDALRNRATRIRDIAVRALRAVASAFLERANGDETAAQPDFQRAPLVRAVREALDTFDLYPRVEVLEVCLWFAEDLDDELWPLLNNPRSRCGHVVQEHLPLWRHPHLAGFLLLALRQADWRFHAQQELRAWHALPEVAALLQRTDWLEDPAIRAALAVVKPPAWFAAMGTRLEKLPGALRRHAPRWLLCVGLGKDQKLAYLTEWSRSLDPHVRRAAAEALNTLGVPVEIPQPAAPSAAE